MLYATWPICFKYNDNLNNLQFSIEIFYYSQLFKSLFKIKIIIKKLYLIEFLKLLYYMSLKKILSFQTTADVDIFIYVLDKHICNCY